MELDGEDMYHPGEEGQVDLWHLCIIKGQGFLMVVVVGDMMNFDHDGRWEGALKGDEILHSCIKLVNIFWFVNRLKGLESIGVYRKERY